jgi:hypothetical protein
MQTTQRPCDTLNLDPRPPTVVELQHWKLTRKGHTMSLIIDGSPVVLGDTLYSRRAGAMGTIVQVLDSAAILRIVRGSSGRDFTVTGNGLIAGQRDVFWHRSLELTTPLGKNDGAKHAKLQAILDTLAEVI